MSRDLWYDRNRSWIGTVWRIFNKLVVRDGIDERQRKEIVMKDKTPGPKGWILRIGELAEVLISLILLVVILILGVKFVFTMAGTPMADWDMEFWSNSLAYCFNLVIGIEFIRMLLKHSAASVVEIVLFTVSRGMVAEHQDGLETLFLVAALAGVFAIRKFLLLPRDEHHPEVMQYGAEDSLCGAKDKD